MKKATNKKEFMKNLRVYNKHSEITKKKCEKF
jgi:hypothetical protein